MCGIKYIAQTQLHWPNYILDHRDFVHARNGMPSLLNSNISSSFCAAAFEYVPSSGTFRSRKKTVCIPAFTLFRFVCY